MFSKRSRRCGVAALAAAGLVLAFAYAAPTVAVAADEPWMNTSLPASERAQLLLDASTQHQKYRWLNEQAANSPQQTTFGGVEYPVQVAGAPTVIYANGAEGVNGTAGTTAWPAPIAVAATWDLALGEQKAIAHGSESFDQRKAVVLGPGLASGRTPLSGRTSEYFGEDALLAGLMAGANVRGLEDGNPDKPVVANLKHYVANEQELDRESSSSNIDERTFRQVYDLPYEIAVADSDPGSIMCSYNQINGVYACENEVLTTSLRDEMGFTGYVMSDFGAVHSTAEALKAGLDQELNRPIFFTPALLDEALANGAITQSDIDRAALRVVTTYIGTGLFDHPVPDAPIPNVSTAEHKALARQVAEKSIVLLKNDDVLPLEDEGVGTVAVIGQTASSVPTNGVSAKTACAAYLVFIRGPVLNCDAIVDPLTVITERVEAAGGTVVYDNGADPAAAAAVAADADTAIVFGYKTLGETTDAADLALTGNGDALISAVAAENDRTIAVVGSGTAASMPWLDDVAGVFHAWYSGEQVGPALTGLLWGDVTPSGKLPMTFPTSMAASPVSTPEQYPGVFADGTTTRPNDEAIRQVNYTEGLEVGYKWYDENDIDPLFEFGFGLSYTDFAYSDLTVVKAGDGDPTTTVGFTVTNTGDAAGAEVPQVYLSLPDAADEPGKRLVGFDRIELEPGASERVEVVVDAAASNHPFEIWDVDADEWRIVEGEYGVEVGASSRDIRLEESLEIDVDTDAPVASLVIDPTTPDGDAGWYVSQVTLDASATDAVDAAPAVEVDVDGAGWAVQDGPVVIDEDGEHSVAARATDAAGNVSATVTWSGKLDRSAPVASAASADGKVALSATDATSGVQAIEWAAVSASGQTPGRWQEYVEPLSVENGALIAFRARDVAGNASVVSEYREVPTPTISVAPGSARPGDTVRVTGTGIPAGSYSVVLRSDPVTVATAVVTASGTLSASFVVPAGTAQGAHTVQLVAADGSVVAAVALRVLPGGALAATGGTAPVLGIVFAALLLTAAGAGLVVWRRRVRVTA